MNSEIVYLGMDLGTYKTSVASSTGVRDTFLTAVGWPKDPIARRMVGRECVVGNETVEHRLALDVIRPFEKGVLKYSNHDEAGVSPDRIEKHKAAARIVVEHAVTLVNPKGCPVYGVIGAPSRATNINKRVLIEAARSAFDAVLIVSEPFSISFGLDRLTNTLLIDLGAGTIDLCPVLGTFPPEDKQVTLPMGGDYIDEQFCQAMRSLYPEVKISMNTARELKEQFGYAHGRPEKVAVTLPVDGKPKEYDITAPLYEACTMIVDPIVEAIRDLVSRFDTEFQQRLLNNIILGGGGSQLRGLDRAIENSLRRDMGCKVTRVTDAVFAGASGALKLAQFMPAEAWDQIRAKDRQHSDRELVAA